MPVNVADSMKIVQISGSTGVEDLQCWQNS